MVDDTRCLVIYGNLMQVLMSSISLIEEEKDGGKLIKEVTLKGTEGK